MPRVACLLIALAACKSAGPGDDDDLRPDSAIANHDAHAPDGAASFCDQAVSRQDFAFIQETVLTPSCATEKCHAGAEAEVGLDLSAGAAYVNLVNKGSSTVDGWMRVAPGSTDQSYLVVALGRAPGPAPRDGFMPIGAPPLCAEQHEMIERWIASGAAND